MKDSVGEQMSISAVSISPAMNAMRGGIEEQADDSVSYINASANGHQETIEITSNANWYVLCDADWIQLSTERGAGDGAFSFIVDSNTETEERTAVISLSCVGVQKTIIITQEAD